MSYKCLECGHIFEEGEELNIREDYGITSCCPICKGRYAIAARCEECGAVYLYEELNGGYLCDECVEDYKDDLSTCFYIGESAKEQRYINGLFCELFTIKEIEAILYEKVDNLIFEGKINCLPFINSDRDWFAERICKEGVKKNESFKK